MPDGLAGDLIDSLDPEALKKFRAITIRSGGSTEPPSPVADTMAGLVAPGAVPKDNPFPQPPDNRDLIEHGVAAARKALTPTPPPAAPMPSGPPPGVTAEQYGALQAMPADQRQVAQPLMDNDTALKLMFGTTGKPGQEPGRSFGAVDLTGAGSFSDLVKAAKDQDPTNYWLAAAGLIPGVKGATVAAKGGKTLLKGAEKIAEKEGGKLGKGIAAPAIKKAPEVDVSAASPYVTDPIRIANPGVYKRPDVIAQEANALVQPEHPALKALFGVTRDDLYQISKQGTRPGNMEPNLWMPGKQGKINEASAAVMTPANAQRLVDTLGEAQKYPDLTKGMVPWYVMDPLYQKMVALVGEKRAKEEYVAFNSTVAPFSAGSAVPTEITRGTAANMFAKRGDLDTFKRFGNTAETKRGADFPNDLRDVPGHMMHGVQVSPVERFLKTGEHGYDKNTVKIPLYTAASGVPQTGFQTRWAVPDTHFASALGMPEVRQAQDFRSYMSGPEYRPVGPWFRDNVAKQTGIEAVPAQALTWGTFAPQTGVRTGIGAGKLELLSQNVWERAQKLGIDPKVLLEQVLRGKNHAMWLGPTVGAGMLANQSQPQDLRQ